jgi:tetrahydrodipicolinate N-succinyltransferase
LLGVNGTSAKGKTKVEVAKMIQSAENEVTIHYNKLHAENAQADSLDIALKKIKHRLVENMSTKTADALGLSRAILCNDSLVKRLQELEGTELMYRGYVLTFCFVKQKKFFNSQQSGVACFHKS